MANSNVNTTDGVKKKTPPVKKVMTDQQAERLSIQEHKSSMNSTKAALNAQPKETIFIPSEDGRHWEGSINGLQLHIPTNKMVEVPRDVARLIRNNTKVLDDSSKMVKAFQSKDGFKVADL